MVGEFLRRKGFWFIDFLKGSVIKNHYNDIKHYNEVGGYDNSQKLKDILQYAKENVPYYSNVNSTELENFPIVDKNTFKLNKDKMMSVEFSGKKMHTVFTSGSTGTPMKAVLDPNKRKRTIADLIYHHDNIGWHLGEKYIFIRNWTDNYKQSFLKALVQNVKYVRIADFSDTKKEELAEYLKKHKGIIIFGYASAIRDFMIFLKKNKYEADRWGIKVIVCDSDELSDKTRISLEQTFKCPVINRYDSEENGLLAISKPYDRKLYLNTASYYFELLKLDSDKPALPGEIGRIVLTDLYNKAMPFIRYDNGDLGISYDSGEIKILDSLAGRKSGVILSSKGELVSDVSISAVFEICFKIEKYRVIQNDWNKYEVKYVGDISSQDEKKLLERLYICLGKDAVITLSKVEDIPASNTGKYQTTLNNYSNKGDKHEENFNDSTLLQ